MNDHCLVLAATFVARTRSTANAQLNDETLHRSLCNVTNKSQLSYSPSLSNVCRMGMVSHNWNTLDDY